MDIAVKQLYRYPVKGLSAEALDRVRLSPGQCLPEDRRFAIALGTTEFDPRQPVWLSKNHFIMLMRDEGLARLQTSFAPESGVLTVAEDGEILLQASLTEAEGRREIAAFFDEFMDGAVPGPLRVVEADGHAFADARPKKNASTDKYVSLINLESIRALETAIEAPVEPIRFRANIYFDGPPAWREMDWMEREITAGTARLRVVSPITRCAATEVNPETAERDLAVVQTLMRGFGHNIMGIYAEVVAGGDLGVGDRLGAPI